MDSSATNYRRIAICLLGLVALLLAVCAVRVMVGSVGIPLVDILKICSGSQPEVPAWREVFLDVRLPRLITGVLAGAALGMSGLAMQTLFRNPLADPYVLGVSSGATLGVAILVMAGNIAFLQPILAKVEMMGTIVAAALGAAAVFGLILLVSRFVQNNMTLLILGMLVGYTSGAVVTILLRFSSEEGMQRFISWTFGSFGGVSRADLVYYVPTILLGLVVMAGMSKMLNALLLGENYARSMGVSVGLARVLVICCTSLLAGTVTAYCGPIGFLGIAIPHLCRALFKTSDHRLLVPAVILLGSTLATVADFFDQAPMKKLPLNAVTAIIGAPVVLILILRSRKLGGAF